MDVFLQTLLGSVMLNRHVDEDSSYYEFFSGWIARSQRKWGVLTTREYQNAVGRSEEYLLTTTGDSQRKLQLNISDRSLPWLVLSCHVLLGFTTDAAQISELLVFCGFRKVSEQVIQSIVEWSTYPLRLGMSDASQEYSLESFQTLQKALTRKKKTESVRWRRLGYPKLMWKKIYQHHLSTRGLNSMSNTAGIVFYGLISLGDDLYAVFFIDAVTEALQFSRQYRAGDATELAQLTADAIASYMKEYGNPKYLVLLNPLRGWLHSVMVKALGMLTEPSACQFIAPRQLTTNTKTTPTKVEGLLASIQLMLQDESLMKDYPPFNMIKSNGSWPSVFVENLHWSQNQLSSTHPSGEAQLIDNDPGFGFGKELKVVDLSSLETDDISDGSFELLKCKAPGGDQEKEDTLDFPAQSDKSLDADFAALMKRSGEFNILPGRDYQPAPIDYISRKMILHIWQCFKLQKTVAGSGQGRSIDFDDMVHVLSRGHDVYKVISADDTLWQPKGVELVRGKNDSILIYIATDSATDKVTWWEDGRLGGDVFLHDSMVSFLPKTVEEAVEEGRRRDASIQLSGSDDDSVVVAEALQKKSTRRARRRQGGSAALEESSADESGPTSPEYDETLISELGTSPTARIFTSTQLPAHLRSLYDGIDPAIRESLYDKSNPLIKRMAEHALNTDSLMTQTEDSLPRFYDIRTVLESEDASEDVEMNGT